MKFLLSLVGALVVSVGSTQAAELSLWVEAGPAGNYVVKVQNIGDTSVIIYRTVVNQRRNDPACTQIPIGYDNGTIFLNRSDYDPEKGEMGGNRLDFITLNFGDERDIVVYRECGRLLEIEIDTSKGTYKFSQD
jgi:hypothetical protein